MPVNMTAVMGTFQTATISEPCKCLTGGMWVLCHHSEWKMLFLSLCCLAPGKVACGINVCVTAFTEGSVSNEELLNSMQTDLIKLELQLSIFLLPPLLLFLRSFFPPTLVTFTFVPLFSSMI